MTTLNFSITKDAAYLSQDRAAYDVKDLPDLEVKAKDAEVTARYLYDVSKIFVGERFICGGAGAYAFTSHYQGLLNALEAPDIDSVNEWTPDTFRWLLASNVSVLPELIVINAGWSKARGRVVGYLYDYRQNFEPVELTEGVTCMPEPDTTAPDYAVVAELGRWAVQGQSVEQFHEALFQHQLWQLDQGRLRAGCDLSRQYDLAIVDKAGARMKPADVLEVA